MVIIKVNQFINNSQSQLSFSPMMAAVYSVAKMFEFFAFLASSIWILCNAIVSGRVSKWVL